MIPMGSLCWAGRSAASLVKHPKIRAFHAYWHTEYATDDPVIARQIAKVEYLLELARFNAQKAVNLGKIHAARAVASAEDDGEIRRIKLYYLDLAEHFVQTQVMLPPAELFFAGGGVISQRGKE